MTSTVGVGRRLPPTLVFLPQSRVRQRYLARYAPVAGEWPEERWHFDGVALGRGRVVWTEADTITRVASPASDGTFPPERVGLLLAHEGRFVPEGIARMAAVQDTSSQWLMDLLRQGVFRVENAPHALGAPLPKPGHGTLRGFNYKGSPWVPNPRRRA